MLLGHLEEGRTVGTLAPTGVRRPWHRRRSAAASGGSEGSCASTSLPWRTHPFRRGGEHLSSLDRVEECRILDHDALSALIANSAWSRWCGCVVATYTRSITRSIGLVGDEVLVAAVATFGTVFDGEGRGPSGVAGGDGGDQMCRRSRRCHGPRFAMKPVPSTPERIGRQWLRRLCPAGGDRKWIATARPSLLLDLQGLGRT
jgi:hypothetical protein